VLQSSIKIFGKYSRNHFKSPRWWKDVMVDSGRSAPVAALLMSTLIFHFSTALCERFFAVSYPLETISANPGLDPRKLAAIS